MITIPPSIIAGAVPTLPGRLVMLRLHSLERHLALHVLVLFIRKHEPVEYEDEAYLHAVETRYPHIDGDACDMHANT